jgi:hypothetical protein
MMIYQVHTLRDNSRPGSVGLIEYCQASYQKQTQDGDGVQLFGIFATLFGLASNEVYLVTFSDEPHSPNLASHIELVQSCSLIPTARPVEHNARTSPGVYVFRWFTVNPGDVDEIVALSTEAWKTFEKGFDTQVQGLFRGQDDDSLMLLLTWYKDLSVWEASRHPPPQARENFMKRHQLTLNARPIATRLIAGAGSANFMSDG